MFNKKIDRISPYVPGISAESLKDRYPDCIKLASNENPWGPACSLADCAHVPIERYPDYTAHPLIHTLAKQLSVSPSQLILGNGSDELFQLIALATICPGDAILSSECTFSEYEFVAHITDASFVAAPLVNHTISIPNLIARITPHTKLIFIANPNNPTGTYVSHTAIEQLLENTPPHTLVVLDEAYAEYVTAPDYPRSMALVNQYPNLMVTRTFSKLYGLANLRVGYGIANPTIIQNLHKVRQPFNVNGLALECAYRSLSNHAFVQKTLTENTRGAAYLRDALARYNTHIPPSEANFLYIQFNDRSIDHLPDDLIRRGVIIRSMKRFGQTNAIRVTIGTSAQNERFIKELHACLTTP